MISTWGHISLAGITELEFFDSNGVKIDVTASMLKILNSSGNALMHAHWMLSGCYTTTDEWKMWTAAMPDFWKALEI